ncbi:MAG: type II toxin-antitoxin system RelE/ParE family toxin [Xanthomonadales bacterium]|nr:type II toxin-antitoxin system RelE/ParE family toxin [Xanthomonadales bacterium]
MNKINWTKKAIKQLKGIDRTWQKKIVNKVSGLNSFPETPATKALTKHDYGYRLRVGNYRVLFDFYFNIVTVQEVKKRDERTY